MIDNAKLCPICNEKNGCGIEEEDTACWCTKEVFSKKILALVPEEKRNKACICKKCVEKFT